MTKFEPDEVVLLRGSLEAFKGHVTRTVDRLVKDSLELRPARLREFYTGVNAIERVLEEGKISAEHLPLLKRALLFKLKERSQSCEERSRRSGRARSRGPGFHTEGTRGSHALPKKACRSRRGRPRPLGRGRSRDDAGRRGREASPSDGGTVDHRALAPGLGEQGHDGDARARCASPRPELPSPSLTALAGRDHGRRGLVGLTRGVIRDALRSLRRYQCSSTTALPSGWSQVIREAWAREFRAAAA